MNKLIGFALCVAVAVVTFIEVGNFIQTNIVQPIAGTSELISWTR